MSQGYPFAAVLACLIAYNVILYFLWGLVRWRERVQPLPFFGFSAGVLVVLLFARGIWGVLRDEFPPSLLGTGLPWLLGFVVVNTLVGAATFAAIRGGARLLEGKGEMEIPPEAPPAPPWNVEEGTREGQERYRASGGRSGEPGAGAPRGMGAG